MKNIKHYIAVATCLVILVAAACKKNDGYNKTPISGDTTKPGVVTDVKVDNFNGGAYITYNLPNSENILYVLAQYNIRDGVKRETKSSYYTDTVTVNGFAASADYDVTLYTVSRANVMSDPVTVKVHPETPVYQLIRPSINVNADFGGVNVQAFNPLKKEIGIIITAFDATTNSMEVQDQFFTKADTINYSIRGYSTDPRQFGVYVTDQWGNISDTLKREISPLYEELLNKSLFSAFNLPSDTPIGYGWQLPNLWNGTENGDGWHTLPGEKPPFVCTFDVGRVYKLSRFVMWERFGEWAYGHGNPRDFSLWGTKVANPKDAKLPISAPEGAVVGDWINLGNFHFPDPPSGSPPGSTTASDEAFVRAGVNFNVPFDAPTVRFIRLAVNRSWSGGDIAHVMELSLYGNPQ